MTNWFQPFMFLNVAFKAFICGTFGNNYADRRELQAALSNKGHNSDIERLRERSGTDKDEIWIDVICDTGCGLDSTFSVARKVAQAHLPLKTEYGMDAQVSTTRGYILILGGDEFYPFPSLYKELYHAKCVIIRVSGYHYENEIKQLLTAGRANVERFPGDFMIELTADEFSRCQIGTLK